MCNTCWWYSISLNQSQILRTLRTGVSYQGKKVVAVFSLDGLRSDNWNETVQVMRNRIRSGRELPHVEKSYCHTHKFATDYPWFSSFLGWNPLLGAWPKQKWDIWQPDCKFTKNLYNIWFHLNNYIYRQQKEKGKKKRNKGCQTHQNPTYQLRHHHGGPLRGASAGLATKLIISAFLLFHCIIIMDKAIETLAQSWLSCQPAKQNPQPYHYTRGCGLTHLGCSSTSILMVFSKVNISSLQ